MKFSMCNEFCEGRDFRSACRLAADAGYQGIEVAPFTLADSVDGCLPVDGDDDAAGRRFPLRLRSRRDVPARHESEDRDRRHQGTREHLVSSSLRSDCAMSAARGSELSACPAQAKAAPYVPYYRICPRSPMRMNADQS